MASQDIYKNLLPLLNTVGRNSGAMLNNPRYNQAANIAAKGQAYRQGLDRQLTGQKAKMYGGEVMALASPIVGAANPAAGGALFGAGNAMIKGAPLKTVAKDAMIGGAAGKAGDVIMAKAPAAIGQILNRVAKPADQAISRTIPLEGNMTAGAFGGNPNIGAVARPMMREAAPTPNAITAGQVTNNFANQAPGNTIIRQYPQNNQSLEDLIQASKGNLNAQPTQGQMMAQQVQQNVPQTMSGGVSSMPLNNVTNDFTNTAPYNTVIQPTPQGMPNYGNLDEAVNGFMNDLNSSLNNQFGVNSAPIGSEGALGNLINAENFGGGMMPSAGVMQQGLDSTRDMSNQFLGGGMGW